MITVQPATYSHPGVAAVRQRDAAHLRVRRVAVRATTPTVAAAAASAAHSRAGISGPPR